MQNPPMHIHRDWRGLPASARGASVAMGNFDGVHLGHRAVIDAARAARPDAPLGAVTFEPHPREYFARAAGRSEPPFRLMNPEARANRLARHGVAQLYELPFGPTLAGLTPEEFAREVLAEGLGVVHVAVGADFRFGRDRAGDAAALASLGKRLGFGVTIVPLVAHGAARASSTRCGTTLSSQLANPSMKAPPMCWTSSTGSGSPGSREAPWGISIAIPVIDALSE